jgi:hypothetical protein
LASQDNDGSQKPRDGTCITYQPSQLTPAASGAETLPDVVRPALARPHAAFTVLAILTLAVGIGTNTTIFAIVDELAFKPARGTGAEHVYQLGAIQIPDYDTLAAERPAGVEAIAAYDSGGGGLLQIPGRAERVYGWRVSGGYAEVQSVRAQAGRWITAEDNFGGDLDPLIAGHGVTRPIVLGRLGANVCVISDRIWREWFNAAPDVALNGTVVLDRTPMRIVGVAPERFETGIDIWTPFGQRRLLTPEELEARRSKKPYPGWRGPIPPPTQPVIQVLLRKDPRVANAAITERLAAALASRLATPEMPAGPGVLLASVGTRYFQAEVRDLYPAGLTVWIAVPILMLGVGVLAAYIPARRAARVDPYRSLKEL